MHLLQRRRRGHSLIEILVVMAILLIVIGMVVTVFVKLIRIVNAWQ